MLLPMLVIMVAVCSCGAKVKEYRIEVVKEYNHDTSAYTQGLFFHNGTLYESTGQYGESSIRIVDLETGRVTRKLDFGRKYFAEGSVILGDRLYVLTWTNKMAFTYNAETLEYIGAYSYPREGWGLTTDGTGLIASDGSSRLYFLDAELKLQRSVNVTLNGRPIRNLNELEWIDGKIWANVYLSDLLVIIDPQSGKVEATVDCNGLLPKELRSSDTDVLNGIAVLDGRIFLTGKYWPRLYEVKLK